MAKQILYRVGQAAKDCGVSSYRIRRLCETGMIDAEFSGNQWQIPAAEVERLKRNGVPSAPKVVDSDDVETSSGPNTKDRGTPTLLADPSPEMVSAAEQAEMSGRQLTVAKNQLEQSRVRRDQAEIEDFFTDRQKRLQQQEADELKRYQEELEADAQTQRKEEAAERRREFFSRWIQYALQRKPSSVPDEIELEIHAEVLAALAKVDTNERDDTVRRLVHGAVERGLRTWKAGENKRAAVENAITQLPHDMRWYEPWKGRAARIARESLKDAAAGASKEEMTTLARTALQPLVSEFEYSAKVEQAVNSVFLADATYDELCDARERVREALAEVPNNASARQIATAKDQALAPVSANITERITREKDQRQREKAQHQRDRVLSSIPWQLPSGISDADREDATAEISEALDELPDDASEGDLEMARDEVLEYYQQKARRAAEKAEQKSRLVRVAMNAIRPYAERILKDYDGYDPGETVWSIESRVRNEVRTVLEEELTGKESEQQEESTG